MNIGCIPAVMYFYSGQMHVEADEEDKKQSRTFVPIKDEAHFLVLASFFLHHLLHIENLVRDQRRDRISVRYLHD
jgi:hypothetical protein